MQPKLHNYCIEKTFELLYNDSKQNVLNTIFDPRISTVKPEERIKLMQHGSYIIDRLAIKKLRIHWFGGHYLYPHSHAGYIRGFSDAGTKCLQLFNIAAIDWEYGRFKKSFMALGGAIHLVQDLCIPFHTTNMALKKHVLFERWMSSHYLDVDLKLEHGTYKFKSLKGHYRDTHPFGWVDYNAHNSSMFLPELLYAKTKIEYFNSMNRILPEAIKTSAGFLELFAKKVGKA
jgi:phospholipase C